jgi:hypothetical protein
VEGVECGRKHTLKEVSLSETQRGKEGSSFKEEVGLPRGMQK